MLKTIQEVLSLSDAGIVFFVSIPFIVFFVHLAVLQLCNKKIDSVSVFMKKTLKYILIAYASFLLLLFLGSTGILDSISLLLEGISLVLFCLMLFL